jgi:hypothetical protein
MELGLDMTLGCDKVPVSGRNAAASSISERKDS